MADLLKAYAVALASLLAGAAFVHSIYKPDLVRTNDVTSPDRHILHQMMCILNCCDMHVLLICSWGVLLL